MNALDRTVATDIALAFDAWMKTPPVVVGLTFKRTVCGDAQEKHAED